VAAGLPLLGYSTYVEKGAVVVTVAHADAVITGGVIVVVSVTVDWPGAMVLVWVRVLVRTAVHVVVLWLMYFLQKDEAIGANSGLSRMDEKHLSNDN
jgi:hypothetical protein